MYVEPKVRVQEVWMDYADAGIDLDADDVARELVDQDVAAGLYEGCSTELESCYTEYLAVAKRAFGEAE